MKAVSRQDDGYGQAGHLATVLLHSTTTRSVELERLADLIASRIADKTVTASVTALLRARGTRGAAWAYEVMAPCERSSMRRDPQEPHQALAAMVSLGGR